MLPVTMYFSLDAIMELSQDSKECRWAYKSSHAITRFSIRSCRCQTLCQFDQSNMETFVGAKRFVNLTKEIWKSLYCSLHFSWGCLATKIISTALFSILKPNIIFLIISAFERNFGQDVLCPLQKGQRHLCCFHSIIFYPPFVDGNYIRMLPFLRDLLFLYIARDMCMQFVTARVRHIAKKDR